MGKSDFNRYTKPKERKSIDEWKNFPFRPEMKKYEIVDNRFKLARLANKMRRIDAFAFDTETNSLRFAGVDKNSQCVCITISWGDYDNYYIPIHHLREEDFHRNLDEDLVVKYLKPIFEREDIVIAGNNLKFDRHVMARLGIMIRTKMLFDNQLASWLVDENTPNGLKENAMEKLGILATHFKETTDTVPNDVKKDFGYASNSKVPYSLVLIEDGAPYALADSFNSWNLYLGFSQEIVDQGVDKIFYKKYMPFSTVLFNMEERGIKVDVEKLQQMGVDMQADIDELQYKIYELAGVEFNIGSSDQKAMILYGYDKYELDFQDYLNADGNEKVYEKYHNSDAKKQEKMEKDYNAKKYDKERERILGSSFGFKVTNKTKAGAPSTDSDTIENLSRMQFKTKRKQEGVEMCQYLLEYSKLAKLKTAFVDGIQDKLYDDGRCHPSFNQTGTDSGRISCSEPNLQQLPNADEEDKYQIRDCFIGSWNEKYGVNNDIISIDYSNLEVRVIAHFSKDKGLLDAFEHGVDLHGNTAKLMFRLDCDPNEVKKKYPNLRQQGKVIAFLLQYGGSAYTLYLDLNKRGELDTIAREQCKNPKSDFYGCKKGEEVAQRLMDLYFDAFSGIANFMRQQKKRVHRQGYVETILGRKRHLTGIWSNDPKEVAYNERLSINACIQGSGADIISSAQIKADGGEDYYVSDAYVQMVAEEHPDWKQGKFIAWKRLQELDAKMLVQIHDELLFECPPENCDEAGAIINDCMCNPFGEKVKLNVALATGCGHSPSYQGGH